MDNNKPYNEFDEQFNDLPLPGEEQSWQKMKQMLDEDDRKRKPLVPIFLKSCAGWGLASLLVITAAWFILKPQQWWQHQKTDVTTEKNPDHNALHPNGTNKSVPAEDHLKPTDVTETGGISPSDVNKDVTKTTTTCCY